MPKSRRQLRKKRKDQKIKTKKTIKGVFILSFLLLSVFLIFFFWKLSSVEKFSFVRKTKDGGAEAILYIPDKEKVLVLEIPANTQLELSESLGVYKLDSTWKLSEKDSSKADLVVRTIVKNFSLPVYLWKTDSSNNLGFFRNLKMSLIEKKFVNVSEERYDLSQTSVLKQKKLKDGSEGFDVSGSLPAYILVNFAKEYEVPPKAKLIDNSGDFLISDKLSSILSNMGIKISSYSKNEVADGGCRIFGSNTELVSSISKVLHCDITTGKDSESDVVIQIGKNFAKNF